MEDSEQRKKRLKEMRDQADRAEVSGVVDDSGMPGLLSNPLNEDTPSSAPSQAASRFDFYTDPMSAFSSNKRNNNSYRQPALDNRPPPSFNNSPVPRFSTPYPVSTDLHMTPYPTQVSLPPYRNPVWNGSRGPPHYNVPFCPPGVGTYPRPGFEPYGAMLYNSGQGIVQRPSRNPSPSPVYRNSPSPNRGRGRGFWNNNRSSVSGQRPPRFHGNWSNEDRARGPDGFCKTSMVEDPWKLMTPVIWKETEASSYKPGSSKPWISKSATTKMEGSSAPSVKQLPEPSLAEYLAAAFSEAANEAADNAENV